MFPKQSMTIVVPAGKDFSFQVWAKDSIAVGTGYCNVVMTFRPENDVRYLVGVLTDSQGCAPLVSREIVKPNGEKALIREASQRIRATRKSVPGRVSCRI
jgi:hypothetical protein